MLPKRGSALLSSCSWVRFSILRLSRRYAARRSACVMYVASCGSFRSLRVCWRVMWWVVHTHAYGGLSVVPFVLLQESSSFPALAASLSLSLSLCLSHLEPTERVSESTSCMIGQSATAISMGWGVRLLASQGYGLYAVGCCWAESVGIPGRHCFLLCRVTGYMP